MLAKVANQPSTCRVHPPIIFNIMFTFVEVNEQKISGAATTQKNGRIRKALRVGNKKIYVLCLIVFRFTKYLKPLRRKYIVRLLKLLQWLHGCHHGDLHVPFMK